MRLSVVVPCFNEAAVVRETHGRLMQVLVPETDDLEVVYVNDGSRDDTLQLLRELSAGDPHVRVIDLSRNFGHQLAVSAGLEAADGDAIVVIDADLQDPPEVIPRMIERWREGYDVVYGVRTQRAGETQFKRWSASLFYRLINRMSDIPIPLDTGDFRLLDRRVARVLRSMPERARFIRGMVSWAGYRQCALPYERHARHAGETKYPLLRMISFALDAVTSFSTVPLRMATYLGFASAVIALLGVVAAVVVRLTTNNWVPGWAALFVATLFVGGIQLLALGIVGEYVGRIYAEAKGRPLYLVAERIGFGDPPRAPRPQRKRMRASPAIANFTPPGSPEAAVDTRP